MSQSDLYTPNGTSTTLNLDDFEQRIQKSPVVAVAIIVGLPLMGIVAVIMARLPLFAAMMAGGFLCPTALVCHKAMARFTGRTLRLLVAARLVLVLALAMLLFGTSGNAWVAVVSALLLWLTADRLLGRRGLYDLWKLSLSKR